MGCSLTLALDPGSKRIGVAIEAEGVQRFLQTLQEDAEARQGGL